MEGFDKKWLTLFIAQLGMIVFLLAVLIFAPDGLSEGFRSGLESIVLVLIGSSVGQGATGNMTAAKKGSPNAPTNVG